MFRSGCTFFVNPNSGDDENGGTEEDPFKTIRHALTMIKSSDASTTIINLSAGRFSTMIMEKYFLLFYQITFI